MSSEDLTGSVIAGYRLLERVGEGGTAIVYRALHGEHGPCAFKILRPKMRADRVAAERFLREASYGARVLHHGVVRTFEYGEAADGVQYIALEWADGELLAKFIRRTGPVACGLAVTIVRQVAEALAAAHAAGIIHRDLKPENIIYDPRTHRARLLDFGHARDADTSPEERLTRTGFFVGTLQYVAPEALSGALVDESADIYSLATIAFLLLCAQLPYAAKSPRELFHQLLTRPPHRLTEARPDLLFPRGLEDVVARGLHREPAQRQASVIAFAEEFAAVAEPAAPGSKSGLMGSLKDMFGTGR